MSDFEILLGMLEQVVALQHAILKAVGGLSALTPEIDAVVANVKQKTAELQAAINKAPKP